MQDVMVYVNFLLAAASIGLSIWNARKDRRNRFLRWLTVLAALYFAVYYALIIANVPQISVMIYARYGITVALTAIVTREIYDYFAH